MSPILPARYCCILYTPAVVTYGVAIQVDVAFYGSTTKVAWSQLSSQTYLAFIQKATNLKDEIHNVDTYN